MKTLSEVWEEFKKSDCKNSIKCENCDFNMHDDCVLEKCVESNPDLKLDLNELHSCQDEECKKSYKRYNWWKNDAKCCEDCIYRLKKNNGLYDYNDCSIDEVIFVFECWLLKQNLQSDEYGENSMFVELMNKMFSRN